MPGYIGKYEVAKTLGSGATCKVKLGRDSETGEKVAIKIMNKDMESFVENEVSYIRELSHRHVI